MSWQIYETLCIFCRISPSPKPVVLAEITPLRQYIGGTIVYFLNRQGGSNLQDECSNNRDFADFWGVHLALPIGGVIDERNIAERNILSRFDYSSRHRLLMYPLEAETEICFLHKNDTFKMQITLDRHNLRLNLNDDLLPEPPHFSLPSIFKGTVSILTSWIFF